MKKWTEAAIRTEAAKYGSRSAFEAGSGSAVNAARARHPGLLDDLFPRQVSKPLTLEAAMQIGRTYSRRSDFMRGATAAYEHCRKAGVLDQLGFDTNARSKAYLKWTEAAIRAEAAKYTCKGDFETFSRGASERARKMGIIDDLGLASYPPSDNDAIYIWRAVGVFHNGLPVYKVGVTSWRLGNQRIEQVAKETGMQPDIIFVERTSCKASVVEKKLLHLGEPCGFTGFNGASEFRAMSPAALDAALSVVIENI